MLRFGLCLSLALAAGCASEGGPSPDPGGGERPNAKADPAALAEGKKYLLPSEPAGAKGVIEVRKGAKDGDEVVLAGQVGGAEKPFTEGRANFLIVDASLKPTAECDCPWDFCEYPKKELAAARVGVKFVDAEGKTLRTGAREMFGIKELSSVVVKGKLSRDEKDNVLVLATAIYVRPERK